MHALRFRKFSRCWFLKDANYFRILVSFLVFSLGLFQPLAAIAQNTLHDSSSQGIFVSDQKETLQYDGISSVESDIPSYDELITEFIALQEGRDASGSISDTDKESRRAHLLSRYETYVIAEKERLKVLGIDQNRQSRHLKMLEEQMRSIGGTPTLLDKVWQFVAERVFGSTRSGVASILDSFEDAPASPPLENPSSFSAPPENPVMEAATNLKGIPQQGQTLPKAIKDMLTIEEVHADVNALLPVLADVHADGGEVQITDDMRGIALSLNNNPVEIFNYLSNTILYEPYAGAVKGSGGCLKEKACNDIDSASLAIALLRASGIPARYAKSMAVFTPQQIKELIGVDDLKSAVSILGAGGAGYHFGMSETLSDGSTKSLVGNLQDLDLSRVSAVAVEWVYPKAYVAYDERGANMPNTLDTSQAATDEELQAQFSVIPSAQWIPFDVAVKPHKHTKADILADAAGIDAEGFWKDYLKTLSAVSPIEAYAEQVRQKTGKGLFDIASLSTHTVKKRTLPVLPPATPYALAVGAIGDTQIDQETWPTLPDERRVTVAISLKNASDASVVFEQILFASVANNTELTLSYEGATDADAAIINDYDGIAHAPPSLLTVVPILSFGGSQTKGKIGVSVGTPLVLGFRVLRGTVEIDTNEKYSVAGNTEGIYSVFTQVHDDPSASSPDAIMVRGPAAIARAYVKQTLSDAHQFSQGIDYRYVPLFARAVVTDNRIVKNQNGVPISFEFSGLTMDATLLIAGASARGSAKDHRKEFHLIGVGLNASYYESQIFADLAGLDGISTVTGLQYAYSRPNEYSVKTITSKNSGDIDALSLPTNTKNQMKELVSAGDTIITPSGAVTKDAWSGIFYVDLRPDFTATYAIGEQTSSNGGRSTDKFKAETWTDETSGKSKKTHQATKDRVRMAVTEKDKPPQKVVERVKFIQKEDAARTITCTIPDATFQAIVSGSDASGWTKEKYGVPCYEEKLKFGENDHRFVIATDGAYFRSAKRTYNFWVNDRSIESAFAVKVGTPVSMARLYPYWGTYRNETYNGSADPKNLKRLDMYDPISKSVYSISDEMARQYDNDTRLLETYMPGLLGFPTSALADTAVSPFEKNGLVYGQGGKFQKFTNGTLYIKSNWWPVPDAVYPVIGKINGMHTDLGGSASIGLPTMNPEYVGDSKDAIFQTFESGKKFTETLGSGPVAVGDSTQTISFNREFGDQERPNFFEGLQDGLLDLGIAAAIGAGVGLTIGAALKVLPEKIAKRFGAKAAALLGVKFVPFVGWAFAGATVSLAAYNAGPLYDACNKDIDQRIEGKEPAYFCGLMIVAVSADLVGAKNPLKGAVKGSLNKLGVTGKAAQAGKTRFVELLEKNASTDAKEIARILGENKGTRTSFFEHLNLLKDGIPDEDLAKLVAKPRILEVLMNRGPLQPHYLDLVADQSDLWKKTFRLTRSTDRLEWERIKNLDQTKKGSAGEDFWQLFIPQGKKLKFTITEPGIPNRVEDIFIAEDGMAYEIKNYANEVSASEFIKSQVRRDAYLRDVRHPNFRSVWVFVDKGPNGNLENLLRENMIDYIRITL